MDLQSHPTVISKDAYIRKVTVPVMAFSKSMYNLHWYYQWYFPKLLLACARYVLLPNRALVELFSARERKVPSRCGEPFLTLRNVPWHADEFITVSLRYMPIKNKNVERYCQNREKRRKLEWRFDSVCTPRNSRKGTSKTKELLSRWFHQRALSHWLVCFWSCLTLPDGMVGTKLTLCVRVCYHVCVHACMCVCLLSLIHIWRCRRAAACISRWSPYH